MYVVCPRFLYQSAGFQGRQGRIYCKPGPVQKKMWGPRAPYTIIGLLLPPTVPSIVKQSKNRALFRKKCLSGIVWIFVTNLSEVMSYSDCDQYQFGFKKGHSPTFCAGIVKQSIDYYISTGDFGVLARCWNFFGSHVGAPFLWGPLFDRTCWTCLNPPLKVGQYHGVIHIGSWPTPVAMVTKSWLFEQNLIGYNSVCIGDKCQILVSKWRFSGEAM